jgi:hypothetical protein
MRQVYLGTTLINDVFLGSDRMDDVRQDTLPLPIDWLLVGGGASGGARVDAGFGGGGGAGRFVSSSLIVTSSISINTTIGTGGVSRAFNSGLQGQNGGNSTATILGTTYTAPGGGGGGLGWSVNNIQRNGLNGGSGGGAGGGGGPTPTGGNAVTGSPISGFGNNGQNGLVTVGGHGGGASPGQQGRVWLDGITYCVGGDGFSGTPATVRGGGGPGGSSSENSGAGVDGVFKLRYPGTPKATGGTITESDGYTYHTFTSSGTFTY